MIIGADNDPDAFLALMIAHLRSGKATQADMADIADMLDPKGRTNFRLKLALRPGNRNQMDDQWFERFYAIWDIYAALGGNKKATLDQAELPKEDGGLGISRPTAKKYLDALEAHLAAEREMLDNSGGNSAA